MTCTCIAIWGSQTEVRLPCSSATRPSDYHQYTRWVKCLAQAHNNTSGRSGSWPSNILITLCAATTVASIVPPAKLTRNSQIVVSLNPQHQYDTILDKGQVIFIWQIDRKIFNIFLSLSYQKQVTHWIGHLSITGQKTMDAHNHI